ncbi:MAG: hypothetical protein ONB48_15150 [candidate division KSB1 bacterium]|nr:hypothetical protein [candidate division KSB1 bacterium]MDZ7273426.1 hypothetical protein [candidate division KSB1 bacterium]MDZ7286982.1 hypothetical protein [candidate division KSB1 bacterium]MDZ7299665.1 hypothetical protein [candidate division KSB1 bacterium]MDZ7308288.1 hypothetical protein [candidate division KSB1 bacterium]
MHNRLLMALQYTVAVLLVSGCSEHFSDNPHPNQPPETFITIFSERELNAGISRQTLHWWGDDPDGEVVGFIYTFSESAAEVTSWNAAAPASGWTFTTATRETFTLRLAGTDTTYTLRVKAVDDQGAADPSAARQRFPVINTRPVVEFPAGTEVPDTTFTVATFTWSGTDLDGDDTIEKYQYVLDDTNAVWRDLPARTQTITLTASDGLREGRHVFYLRAVDLAGATSRIIRMPRRDDEVWYVREPRSKFLLLDDYNINDNAGAFYRKALAAVAGHVEVWDIKSNNRALEPASAQTFLATLRLFERVLWYADTEPNLEKAQATVTPYLAAGGKLLMTTSFQEFTTNQSVALDFSPVDSLAAKINRLTRNQVVLPAPFFAGRGFPELKLTSAILPNVFPLVPKISADTLYVLPPNPAAWPGTPVMAVVDATSSFVFFGLPIAALDGNGTAAVLIQKILTDIFK